MEWKQAVMSQWSCESLQSLFSLLLNGLFVFPLFSLSLKCHKPLWNEENGLLYICWKVTSRLARFGSRWWNELSLPVGFCHVTLISWSRLISPGRNISRHGELLLSCFSNSVELLAIASPCEIVRHGHLCCEGTRNSLELPRHWLAWRADLCTNSCFSFFLSVLTFNSCTNG